MLFRSHRHDVHTAPCRHLFSIKPFAQRSVLSRTTPMLRLLPYVMKVFAYDKQAPRSADSHRSLWLDLWIEIDTRQRRFAGRRVGLRCTPDDYCPHVSPEDRVRVAILNGSHIASFSERVESRSVGCRKPASPPVPRSTAPLLRCRFG